MNNRFNSVPVMVQQIGESLRNDRTPENVRFNQAQVMETIRDYCNYTLEAWNKDQLKKTKTRR